MSEGRRRQLEEERQAGVFARAIVKELTRAQELALERRAARERWLALSPEERKKHEELVAEAAQQRKEEQEARQEAARQRRGGSLESWQVIGTVAAYESLLYAALVVAAFCYADLYRMIGLGNAAGDFTTLCRWAGPPICLSLFAAARIEKRIEQIYEDFGKRFNNWKFLPILLFCGPVLALSGLLMFGWLIDRL